MKIIFNIFPLIDAFGQKVQYVQTPKRKKQKKKKTKKK